MRIFATLCVVTAALVGATTASAQVPPPTLTGETLTGTSVITSASCDISGNGNSTFTYQSAGPAVGPYDGTFTETGTVTIGPQSRPFPENNPAGTVTSWTASFTINSPTGTVTGTKSIAPSPNTPDISGVCVSSNDPIPQNSAAMGFQELLAYTATITLSDGSQYRDEGMSGAFVEAFPPAPGSFFETFTSTQPTTVPLCDENSQANQGQGGNDQGCVNP